MIRFDRSHQALAIGVSALAGFVDAVGFVESAGFFVSFMTGNSTRLAVGAAGWQQAGLIAGTLIALFVGGVIAGSLVGARFRRQRAWVVLALVSLLLALAMLCRLFDIVWAAVACLALAMGAVNAALEGRDGAVIGVTYMTGTLVQMGQKMANALRGVEDRRWWPHLALWAGLVAGAIIGARVVLWSAPVGYGLAVGLAVLLLVRAIWTARAVPDI